MVGMNASQPWNDPFLGMGEGKGKILENSLADRACSNMAARNGAAGRGRRELRGSTSLSLSKVYERVSRQKGLQLDCR